MLSMWRTRLHSVHSVPEVLRLAVPVLLSARLSVFFAGQATSNSVSGGGSDFPNDQSEASELCLRSTPNAGEGIVRMSSSGFESP
jgi:hypothetical protein